MVADKIEDVIEAVPEKVRMQVRVSVPCCISIHVFRFSRCSCAFSPILSRRYVV